MSLIHADNFNIYGATVADMTAAGRYSETGGCSIQADPDGVSTGRVIRMIGGFSGTTNLRRALKTPDNKIGIGMRIWLATLPANDDQRPTPFFWNTASNGSMVFVKVNTTGSITAYVHDPLVGAFGTDYELGTTAGPVVTAGAWWHLEAVFDAAALTFELRVEGVPKLVCDSVNFNGHQNNGPTVYQCGLSSRQDTIGAAISVYFKDYFWWDSNGTKNIDFLGACLVAQLDTMADITLGYWVPSVGVVGWSILDNDPANTPYLAGATPVGAAMEFGLTNLPPDISSIKGVISIVRAKKEDGGDGQLQTSMISGVSASNGEDRPITAAFTDWEDVHELDPATGNSWLPAALDAANLRISRTV